MYYSDRVKLVQKTVQKDSTGAALLDGIGNPVYTETATEVWADVKSPSRAEAAAAGAMGLKASAVVTVHVTDYSGQTVVEIDGDRLAVYRTFKKAEDVELYVTEKRGEADGH